MNRPGFQVGNAVRLRATGRVGVVHDGWYRPGAGWLYTVVLPNGGVLRVWESWLERVESHE
jgi:hypothetical protein